MNMPEGIPYGNGRHMVVLHKEEFIKLWKVLASVHEKEDLDSHKC